MVSSKNKILCKAVGFSGLFLSILSFQNCAAPLSALQEISPGIKVPGEYTGVDIATGGLLTGSGSNGLGGASYTDPRSGITIQNTSVKSDNCSAKEATFSIQVYGAGSNPFVCMESFIAGRDSSFRCTDNQYAPLAGQTDWKYSGSADRWTYSVKLANHDIYVPGLYRLYVQGRGATVAASFEIANASSSSCHTMESHPEPFPAQPAIGGAIDKNAPEIKWGSFDQVKKAVVGANYVAYPVDMADLAKGFNRFGQLSSIDGVATPIYNRVISLSKTPGDFSSALSGCKTSHSAENSLNWTHEASPPAKRASYCKVPTTGILYINVSYVNPATGQSSCPAGKKCSFRLSNSVSQ